MEIQRPIYLDVEALRRVDVSLKARGIAVTLVLEVWWPSQEPFDFDPQRLATVISGARVSVEDLVSERDAISQLFTSLPDGRWAPSPVFFSLTPLDPKTAC